MVTALVTTRMKMMMVMAIPMSKKSKPVLTLKIPRLHRRIAMVMVSQMRPMKTMTTTVLTTTMTRSQLIQTSQKTPMVMVSVITRMKTTMVMAIVMT